MKILRSALNVLIVLTLFLAASFIVWSSAEAQIEPVNWIHLSSSTGDLPLPADNTGQSGLRVVDLDKNGQKDYVITLWSAAETVVWYRHLSDSFEKYIIDTVSTLLSHGEKFSDIDGDGDIDLLFGDASWGNIIYWWENPYPDYEPNTFWVRRIVRDSGDNFYHDNIWGDFDGDGSDELIAWNQYGRQLLLFEIPADPRNSGPWPATEIFSWTGSIYKYRGAEAADINLDGKIDFVGGGGWFEHTGGTNFTFHEIDEAMGYSQFKAGQLIPGGRPEVVCVLELQNGPLNMYEWTGSEWQTRTILFNVPPSHTLQIGDVNLDGNLDIMTGEIGRWSPFYEPPDNPDAKISVLYGDGHGNFIQQVVNEGQGDLEGQLADIDNDGDLDIVAKPFRHNIPRIDIYINQGDTPTVDVPYVVGLSQAEAEAAILSAGLAVGTVSPVYSDTDLLGNVINQKPISGFTAVTGWPVDLLVSSGLGEYQQHFEDYASNEDPLAWLDTGANNSLVEDDSLFKVFDLSGEKVFGTASPLANIHSHYSTSLDVLTGFEYTGRMMMTAADSGIGVTFFSDYLNSDTYYRLRRYSTNSFHIAPHGTDISGEIDTRLIPLPNQWYRFRIQVEDADYRTEVRARVWLDGEEEPLFWTVNAHDDTPARLTSGTIGLWSYGSGDKYWDDLIVGPLVQPPGMTDVPDVVGLSQAEAEAAIVTSGLLVGAITTAYSDAVPAGDVISQDPIAGISVLSGSAVDLVISLGPLQLVDVPDVVGLSQAEAEAAIVTSGLLVGAITTAYSDTVPAGDVISQDPIAGISVPSGSAVDLVVSIETVTDQQDFEGYVAGEDPADWLDTGANNSLVEDDSLFKVFDLSGEKVFGTASPLANIHSHYSTSLDVLTGFEYTGRMMMTAADGGIGVTFLSDYPNSDSYYRLRRYSTNSFRISPHGTSVAGDVETNVVPLPNTWYAFKIRVEDTGSRTEIRARVWAEGSGEPPDWQVDCYDDTPARLTTGTIGLWSMGSGDKYWDDLIVGSLVPPPDMTDVPDVVGLSQAEAEAAIVTSGLLVGAITTAYSDAVPAGDVISQDPIAGISVPSGSAVDLVISLGPLQLVDVPDVVGLSQAEAEAAIVTSGLLVGAITTAYSDTVPAGDVISQDPIAGISVPSGSAVDLVVSIETVTDQQDFEGYVAGDDPADWLDTGANNSLVEDDSLFKVFDLSGEKVFGTASPLANIHSHYSTSLDVLTGFEYTGRMMMTAADSGIGVTFFSDYPNSDSYYRLRRYSTNSFRISPHGTDISGEIDTRLIPLPNQWYRFRIQVKDADYRTEIRAKVWVEGSGEPSDWQVDCYDDTPARLTTGTIGLWSMNSGDKYWDDLIVAGLTALSQYSVSVDVAPAGSGSVSLDPAGGVYDEGTVVELTATAAAGWEFNGWSGDLAGTANPATLTVDANKGVTATLVLTPSPPTIVTQPVDQTVGEGQTASFSVAATGSGPLSYQWQRDGADITGATAASYTILSVTLADSGALFRCLVTNTEGSATSDEALLTVLPPSARVTDGQVVLYGFQEGSGLTVADVSLVAPALDLTIQDAAAVSWLVDGGLAINSPTLISSVGAATKVIDAVKASGEISVEAWITPANSTQDGPARIVSLSQDGINRNFTLGQGQYGSLPPAVFDMRLRTTATSLNGTPSLTTPVGSATAALTHVVYTRDALGVASIYIDGVKQAGRAESGDISNWDNGYALGLGNEISGGRPWLGDYHLVAIFNRALSAAEVQQNFDAGPFLGFF